jgi:hypothetical protein
VSRPQKRAAFWFGFGLIVRRPPTISKSVASRGNIFSLSAAENFHSFPTQLGRFMQIKKPVDVDV